MDKLSLLSPDSGSAEWKAEAETFDFVRDKCSTIVGLLASSM